MYAEPPRTWAAPHPTQKGFVLHDTQEPRYLNGGDHSLCNNQMSHPGPTYPTSSSLFNQTQTSSASPQHRNTVSDLSAPRKFSRMLSLFFVALDRTYTHVYVAPLSDSSTRRTRKNNRFYARPPASRTLVTLLFIFIQIACRHTICAAARVTASLVFRYERQKDPERETTSNAAPSAARRLPVSECVYTCVSEKCTRVKDVCVLVINSIWSLEYEGSARARPVCVYVRCVYWREPVGDVTRVYRRALLTPNMADAAHTGGRLGIHAPRRGSHFSYLPRVIRQFE